jgi:hypothetical protein
MRINDLAAEIAGDVTDDALDSHIPAIIITILESVITQLIQWFFTTYLDKLTAATKFSHYYKSMGLIRRMILAWQIYWEMAKHPSTNITSTKLASAIINRFQDLTIDDIIDLGEMN